MKIKLLTTTMLLAGAITFASAGKFDQPSKNRFEAISANDANVGVSSTPNSSVTLDFSLVAGASWDGLDDPSNVIANCVSGDSITGFSWTDLTLETEGASWLSEAVILFSDSAGGQGIAFTLSATNAPGVEVSSSAGIVDLTDLALPDIVALADGMLQVQLYEDFDDADDVIDANFTSGTMRIFGTNLTATPGPGCNFVAPPKIIPTTNWYSLFALMLVLMFFGRKLVARKA
ncbi:MAG: hypothetical protein JKX98_03705 [Alcanivoracaceae bacterium]|nr:hypothetical protein [Alcanivoracaceae bacterium]